MNLSSTVYGNTVVTAVTFAIRENGSKIAHFSHSAHTVHGAPSERLLPACARVRLMIFSLLNTRTHSRPLLAGADEDKEPVTGREVLDPYGLYCTVLYCTVRYSTVRCGTVRYGTVRYDAVLYCTVLYCTVLYWCYGCGL